MTDDMKKLIRRLRGLTPLAPYHPVKQSMTVRMLDEEDCDKAAAALEALSAENDRLKEQIKGYQCECREVEQTLGAALGYPWFKDDQKNFPEATDEDGVCVGDHVPGTLAQEMVNVYERLRKDVVRLREAGLEVVNSQSVRTAEGVFGEGLDIVFAVDPDAFNDLSEALAATEDLEGWVLVPREPTEAMLEALYGPPISEIAHKSRKRAYSEMLDAAQEGK